MALVVRITVEGGDLPPKPIEVLQAVRISGEEGELCTYEIKRGNMETNEWETINEKFFHHFDDGAVSLARKMLELIK